MTGNRYPSFIRDWNPIYRKGFQKIFPFTYTPKHPKSCICLCNNHTIAKNFYFLCSISGCQQQANRKTAQIFCIFIDRFFSIIFIRLKQKEIYDMIEKIGSIVFCGKTIKTINRKLIGRIHRWVQWFFIILFLLLSSLF